MNEQPTEYRRIDLITAAYAGLHKIPMEVVDRLEEYVQSLIEAAEKRTAAAYGGCTKCYGKGYASHQTAHTGRSYYRKVDQMVYCTCERGKQLREYVGHEARSIYEEKVRKQFGLEG